MAFALGAALAGDPYSAYARSYQTATDQAGQEAAGKFLQQMFNAPIPGAQSMAPPSPMPGQASQPGGGLMQNLQRLPVVGGMFGGGQPQGPQGGPPAQAMAMSPQPQMQRPTPQAMPQGGGQSPISAMSFPQIVQGLVRSNPGAPPAQIYAALQKLAPVITPFMNAEALAQYRNFSLAQRQENIDIAGRRERAYETSIADRNIQQQVMEIERLKGEGLLDPDIATAQITRLQQQRPAIGGGQPSRAGTAPAPTAAGPTGDTWTPKPRPGYGPPPGPAPAAAGPAAAGPAPGGPAPGGPVPAAAPAAAGPASLGERLGPFAAAGTQPLPPSALLTPPQGGVSTAPPQVNVPMRAPAPQAPAPAAPAPPPQQQIPRPGTLPPGAAPIAQTDQPRQAPFKNIADGIVSGKLSPDDLKNVKIAERGLIINELKNRGFDLALARQEWTAADRIIKSLAGPQMTRFFGAMDAIPNTLQTVRQLSQKLDMGNFTFINRLDLESWAKTQSNTPKGQAAAQYLTATNLLQDELAQVIAGGASPTNRFLEQAKGMTNEAYGQKGLAASLDTVEQVIAYRKQALMAQGGGRVGGANPYLGKTDQPQQPATEGGGDGAPRPQSGGFDVDAARKAGYSQQEIDDYLKRRRRE